MFHVRAPALPVKGVYASQTQLLLRCNPDLTIEVLDPDKELKLWSESMVVASPATPDAKVGDRLRGEIVVYYIKPRSGLISHRGRPDTFHFDFSS